MLTIRSRADKEVNEVINHGPRGVSVRMASAGTHVEAPAGIWVEEERKAAARYLEVNF
ncbi:MAG: hypothetical protein JRJ66_05120 [Deltaproteobacteria bacterium]|nr:hypothetical protein [Deltaproteobacteria bacterium]MBW2299528.1 hypothetical protein [Deltaproteobacteria bacterium]